MTERQQLFVNAILSGALHADAAAQAGYRGSRRVLAVTAARTLQKPAVQAALNAARQAATNVALMRREEACKILDDLARSGTPSEKMMALRIRGRWEGWEAAEKHEETVHLGDPQQFAKALTQMTEAEFAALGARLGLAPAPTAPKEAKP